MDAFRQFVSVAAVLGLLVILAYFVRRQAGQGATFRISSRRPRMIEAVERLALTPQHSLHVVKVAGRLMVLAAAPNGVHVLNAEAGGGLAEPGMKGQN